MWGFSGHAERVVGKLILKTKKEKKLVSFSGVILFSSYQVYGLEFRFFRIQKFQKMVLPFNKPQSIHSRYQTLSPSNVSTKTLIDMDTNESIIPNDGQQYATFMK